MTGRGEGIPPVAIVVGVGDELLLGQTVDTNGAWLSRELSELGFRVISRFIVGDIREEIQGAVTKGLEETDLVVLTGGLGPTPDDLTRPSVAEVMKAPLQEDSALVALLEGRHKARGFGPLPANNRLMALVPTGAKVLPNPMGAAPGLVLDGKGGGTVVLLPGPPREMRGTFSEGVRPFLSGRFGERLIPAYHRTVYTTGIPESLLETKMTPLLPEDMGPVTLAFLPDLRGVRLRFSVRGHPESEAVEWVKRVLEPLEELLSEYRFEAASGDLAEALGEALIQAGATLAVAESCTGGLIGKRMTDHAGSSRYFLGGILAYDNRIKVGELGVPDELLARDGAVSQGVAEAMASGVAHRFGADAGIGITGVAGPGGGTGQKPVGTVWIAATFRGKTVSSREALPGDREYVRERGAQAALALLFRLLGEETP